jgi:hypothetical protein
MSLKIGGSASKTKTSSSSTSTGTTTPIVPQWGSSLTQNIAGQVGGLVGQDPGQYVSPLSALQSQAAAGAAALGGSAPRATSPGVPSGIGEANWLSPYMTASTPFAAGGKAYDYIDRYKNPYLQEVLDTSAADLDAHAGQVRAQQALDLAGSGAFGGSGAALTQSMTEGELARGRASTLSGLRSRAFEQALGAASGDADRATQARIANAQSALQDAAQKVGFGLQAQNQMLAADANRRDNIGLQAQLGGVLRDVDQQQRQAPINNTQQIVAMLNGLPLGLFTGQQKDETEKSSGTSKTKGVTVEGAGELKV